MTKRNKESKRQNEKYRKGGKGEIRNKERKKGIIFPSFLLKMYLVL